MPHLIALAVVGAGLYAGYRWASREFAKAAAEAERVKEEMQRKAAGATAGPKDLGRLEWDAEAGVYRPRRPDC